MNRSAIFSVVITLFLVGSTNFFGTVTAAVVSKTAKNSCDHSCRISTFKALNRSGYYHLVYSQAGRYAELTTDKNVQADWRLLQLGARLKAGRSDEARLLARKYAANLPLQFALQARGYLYYDHLANYRYGRAEVELEKMAKNSDVIYDRALLYRLSGRTASLKQLGQVRPDTKAFKPPPERPGLFGYFASSIFPGGGHLYQGNTGLFLLSFLTVGGLAGLGYYLAVDGQLIPAVISGYFALVFYQVSIVYGYKTLMEEYNRVYRNWENRLIMQSKYRF